MKIKLLLVVLSIILLLAGCTKTVYITEPQQTSSTGKLNFNFDKQTIPAGVVKVKVILTRDGYDNITCTLNLLSDSTADITLNEIPEGTWHLKIDALNSSDEVKYTGETDVKVIAGTTVQLNLTLKPTNSGTGTIYIFVNWGSYSSWLEYIGNPILTRFSTAANPPGGVSHPKTIYDNGIYKMWFYCLNYSARTDIWYAESNDGLSWHTVGTAPVLTASANGWDSYGVIPGAVIKQNNQYIMFYVSYTNYTSPTGIGIATSFDGINWTKRPQPTFFSNDIYSFIEVTDALFYNNTYYVFFHYNGSKIGVATSLDLTNWQFKNILNASLSWETGGVLYPSVLLENNKFKMVYQNKAENSFGYAEADIDMNFTKSLEPIFKLSNANKSYIHIDYPHYRKAGEEYRIYFTSETTQIENTSICLLRFR